MSRPARALLAVSVLSLFFTVPHSVEDFAYNVPQERFGVPFYPATMVLALVYAAQVVAAILTARNERRGHWLNAGLGIAWFLAAALDHLGEVLFAWPYRAGLVSKALEAGIMLSGIAWGALGILAARSTR